MSEFLRNFNLSESFNDTEQYLNFAEHISNIQKELRKNY